MDAPSLGAGSEARQISGERLRARIVGTLALGVVRAPRTLSPRAAPQTPAPPGTCGPPSAPPGTPPGTLAVAPSQTSESLRTSSRLAHPSLRSSSTRRVSRSSATGPALSGLVPFSTRASASAPPAPPFPTFPNATAPQIPSAAPPPRAGPRARHRGLFDEEHRSDHHRERAH